MNLFPKPISFQEIKAKAERSYVEWRGPPQDEIDKIALAAYIVGYLQRASDTGWK